MVKNRVVNETVRPSPKKNNTTANDYDGIETWIKVCSSKPMVNQKDIGQIWWLGMSEPTYTSCILKKEQS